MPNICDFTMKITGKSEDSIRTFLSYLDNDYWYFDASERLPDEERIKKYKMRFQDGTFNLCTNADKHFYRIDQIYPAKEDENGNAVIEKGDDSYSTIIFGDCAWSFYSCTMQGAFTYYSDYKDGPLREHSTCLELVTKELDLAVEVFSSECGMGFSEHILVDRGDIRIFKEYDYREYYIDEYESKENAEKELGFEITDEEWNSGSYFYRCEINPFEPAWSI